MPTAGAVDTASPVTGAFTVPGTWRPAPDYYPTATEFNREVAANIRWLQDNAARLSGAAFSGAISTSGTLGVTGNTVLSTASLSGALTLAVEQIFTGLGTPPSAPLVAGKAAFYLNSSFIPKILAYGGTTTTVGLLEQAQTWAATQTFSAAAVFNGNVTLGDASADTITVNGTPTFLATLTLSGAAVSLVMTAAAGNNRDFMYQSGGVNRWIMRVTNDAESGSDVGSNWALISRTDAGASKLFVIYADRGTGRVGFGGLSSGLTAMVDINSDVIRLRTQKTPASSAAAGNQGDWCADDSFFYVRGTTQWKRAPLSTF